MIRHDYKLAAEIAGLANKCRQEALSMSIEEHEAELADYERQLRECPDDCPNVRAMLIDAISKVKSRITILRKEDK